MKFKKQQKKAKKARKAARAHKAAADRRIHFPSPTGKRGRPKIDQPLCGLI